MSLDPAKAGNIILGVSTLLLGVAIYTVNTSLVPILSVTLGDMGFVLGKPAQLAHDLGPYVLPILVVVAAASLFIVRRKRSERTHQAIGVALCVVNLALVVYLCLEGCVFADVARDFPTGLHNAREGHAGDQGHAR